MEMQVMQGMALDDILKVLGFDLMTERIFGNYQSTSHSLRAKVSTSSSENPGV
jgi:hypothetical protein